MTRRPMITGAPRRSNPRGVAECLGTFGLLAVMPVVSAFQKSPLAFTTLKAAVHPRGRVRSSLSAGRVRRRRDARAFRGELGNIHHLSRLVNAVMRMCSAWSSSQKPSVSSSTRRVFRCSRDKQRTLTSPGCRFWNWRTISGDRKALCNDPRAVKTATRVPYFVGHTTGLHLPAPSSFLFERVRELRDAMSPLSFLSTKKPRRLMARDPIDEQRSVIRESADLIANF